MTQLRISARWLLLCTLSISGAVGALLDVKPCGPDVMCEGKDPKNNPEYFKPTMSNLQRCYCDDECEEYGDCCVDRASFPFSRNENITLSCVIKSYNQTIYAVTNCPVTEGWGKLCEKETYVPQLEYLSDLPVFSNYTNLYYANIYCAYCDQQLWLKYGYQLANYLTKPKLVIQCTPKIDLNLLKTEGQYLPGRLLWKVRDGYCAIFQQEEIERGRHCTPSVSSCPMSAESSLLKKCEAYSQLLSKNDTVFRNPHCAICNGVSESESFCKYQKTSIDFHGLNHIFDLNWHLDICEENMHLHDTLREECKAVNCDMESGKCQIHICDVPCHLHDEEFMMRSGYVIYACLSASIICLLVHVYRTIYISPPKNLPSKILNSLAWSMLFAQTLFLASMYSLAKVPHHRDLCYITAVTTLYFFLASFLWMSVISFDIWFTFANTFKLFSNSYRKYALYAWGGTGVIIIISVIIDQTDYFPSRYRPKFGPFDNACWLGSYNGLALYLAIPVGIVLSINTVFFIMIICLFRRQQSSVLVISGKKEYSLLLFYVKISTVIGMTWVATLLVIVFRLKPEFECALSILNGLQGVFVFITFDLKTDTIFAYVKHLLHRIFERKKGTENVEDRY